MNPTIINSSKTLMLCTLTALVLGCSHQNVVSQPEPIPVDLSSSKAFDDCLASLAEPLTAANTPATYHLGAKYALACLDEAPVITSSALQLSVMQVHALAITQFLKAGDMQEAVNQLNAFKASYPRRDLLLDDGASFVHSVELIVGQAPKEQSAEGSLLNASSSLKSELRRQQYWQVN